jgi:hypothetical protein
LGFTVERRRLTSVVEQLTEASLRRALDEFHRIGRDAFLQHHGLPPADRYVIVDRGVAVDAKAVIHVAWQLDYPGEPPLDRFRFRGDRTTVAEPLRRRGYWVDDLRSTDATEVDPPLGPDPQAYITAARRLDGPLDRGARTTSRVEQQLLRGVLGLFALSTAPCELCGRDVPVGLLVAAHIKRRADCTDEERRDVEHVAMRACVLGCDALFERGLLQVTDRGLLRAAGGVTPALAEHLQALDGRSAPAFRPARAPYFAWHREMHSQRLARS